MRLTQKSLLSALLGAGLWGLSGTASQALFQGYSFPVLGLVTLRMLLSALLLQFIFRPSIPPRTLARLIPLSIFGLAGSQITYLGAIQYSNAATATLLQFLFLPIVAGYEKATGILRWSGAWTAALVLALIGTLLLVAGVEGSSLRILVTPLGLLFGLSAAFAAAYYSLASRQWVREYGSRWVLSWGFLVGGLTVLPLGIISLLQYSPQVTGVGIDEIVLLVGFVIVFGTITAYGLYLYGLKGVSATEAGVASSAEPIVAAAAAFVFLGVVLTFEQYIGGAMILGAVIMLATRRSNHMTESLTG